MARHRNATQRRTLLDRILLRREPAHATRGMTAAARVRDEVRFTDEFDRADLLPGLEWQTPDEWARQHSGGAR
ncbi:hypothetical protein C5E45_32805 [Nocardia nova]|uniref:Uncharacterized protein n=1 Tax=Nocardia nova TaxID=37330 RepID=A0A2S6ACP6_9NOCA|nr:hypothetical protein [Nocardia nova]PPJ31872.1 hypothetical protein C5E45_32805 [Nocardia nova]